MLFLCVPPTMQPRLLARRLPCQDVRAKPFCSCISVSGTEVFLRCSSFMVIVVNKNFYSDLAGKSFEEAEVDFLWLVINSGYEHGGIMNDIPQALCFSFSHSWAFLPKHPKLWLNFVYISGLSQVAFWWQWLLPLLTCNLWTNKSMCSSENSWDNSVVLWELLIVPCTATVYNRPLLLFKEQKTIKDPIIIIGPW